MCLRQGHCFYHCVFGNPATPRVLGFSSEHLLRSQNQDASEERFSGAEALRTCRGSDHHRRPTLWVSKKSISNQLTEETFQVNFKAGLTALSYTTTMMPKDFRRATRKLVHICDGKECVNGKVMLTKQSAIEVLHTQNICQSRSACAEKVLPSTKG